MEPLALQMKLLEAGEHALQITSAVEEKNLPVLHPLERAIRRT